MKGIWLCIGCIVLIFSWLPVYSSFFFLVGALWFLHKRFHRGEIICLVFCLLVFVRIQRLSDVHEISSRIVKIQEIKQGYMIGANREGRFLLMRKSIVYIIWDSFILRHGQNVKEWYIV